MTPNSPAIKKLEENAAQLREQRIKEEERKRPNPIHRVIDFLLTQVVLNNPDCRFDVARHREQLDTFMREAGPHYAEDDDEPGDYRESIREAQASIAGKGDSTGGTGKTDDAGSQQEPPPNGDEQTAARRDPPRAPQVSSRFRGRGVPPAPAAE